MTAREWLETVRECASQLDGLHRELQALKDARRDCLPWQCKGSSMHGSMGGTHSDPTATEAQARIDGLDEQIATLTAKVEECESVVGGCLRTLDVMRRCLGKTCADVVELYYVDCADTWSEVAAELGLHRNTVRICRDAALDWLDGCDCA